MLDKFTKLMISPVSTIFDCFKILDDTGQRILVCADGDKFLGIVTDGDLRRAILANKELIDVIGPHVNRNPVVAKEGLSSTVYIELMKDKMVDILPIIGEDGELVDIASTRDLASSIKLPNAAVIMAGGEGRRLLPLTEETPKPLLKVGGKAIIEHIINKLSANGITDIFVTVNYKKNKIMDYLGNGNQLGVNIKYLEEPKKLGTVGSLSLLKGNRPVHPFIMINCDILAEIDFRKIIANMDNSDYLMSVCLTDYQFIVPYGVVDVDEDKIVSLSEKPEFKFHINAGVYCFHPAILDRIPEGEYYDVTSLMDDLIKGGEGIGYNIIDKYWKDIGHHDDLYSAYQDLLSGRI